MYGLQEFDEWFSIEEACVEYLERLRCPDRHDSYPSGGVDYPRTLFPMSFMQWIQRMAHVEGVIRCAYCQRKTSVIAGTMFEGTRKPLRLWFQMWYVMSKKLMEMHLASACTWLGQLPNSMELAA